MDTKTATMGQENGNSTKKTENSTSESKEFEEKFLRATFICRLLISCIWPGGVLYATYHVYIFAEGKDSCAMPTIMVDSKNNYYNIVSNFISRKLNMAERSNYEPGTFYGITESWQGYN